MNKYVCQTPQEFCTGGLCATNNGFNRTKNLRMHSSPETAFKCHSQWLVKAGYEKLGSREFRQPEGGILILTKPCRYGGKMRKGKNDLGGKKAKRFMPASIRKTAKGGVVIG